MSQVEIWSQGAIYPSEKAADPITSVQTPLALKPGETEVFYGRTTNDSYRIEWHNAHPNRDANQLVDAAIELKRNGDALVTENGVTTEIPYEIPFEHDGFGQDDDWVTANIDDADAALASGYPDWVDAQVGVGLTNGLYKFTAYFADDPPEPTQLYIGDYSICVTNAGEYSFVLEKGIEYTFGTWPFNEDVDYWMQDDMAPDAPMLTAWWGGWESPGEWTIDGGWSWLVPPHISYGSFYDGYCSWWPTLQGSPDVVHLGPSDFPKLFTAVVNDYPHPEELSYEWRSSDENVRILSPHASSTLIAVDSMPDWDFFGLSVSTEINGWPYTSSVRMGYGTNDTGVAALRMSAPEVVFVNDDERTSRWYRVSVRLSSPTPTNAVLSISHSGGAQVVFASDPEGRNRFELADVNLAVYSYVSSAEHEFYFAAKNSNCTGTFTATCTLQDSTALEANREYKVIEPLRKLVSTVVASGGDYVNPSRLTYGADAWLEVDYNGIFPSQDIRWRIVSGPGEIVSTNRYRACVRATATVGTVVVEAAFGSDSLIQPRFVLPVVEKVRVPICVYYVEDASGSKPLRLSSLENDVELANSVFAQVGVEFFLEGSPQTIADASYARLPLYAVEVGPHGRRRLTGNLSNMARSFLAQFPSANETRSVVYVHEILNGTKLAFTFLAHKVVVMGAEGSTGVLAHELGHTLGLDDIYSRNPRNPLQLMPGWSDPAHSAIFSDVTVDWGDESGRSFYEISDSHGELIDRLLMNGFDDFGGRDIPSGSVRGYPPRPSNSFDRPLREVGASKIRENLR